MLILRNMINMIGVKVVKKYPFNAKKYKQSVNKSTLCLYLTGS